MGADRPVPALISGVPYAIILPADVLCCTRCCNRRISVIFYATVSAFNMESYKIMQNVIFRLIPAEFRCIISRRPIIINGDEEIGRNCKEADG